MDKLITSSPAESDLHAFLNPAQHDTRTIQNDQENDYAHFLAIPAILLVFVMTVIVAWCIKTPVKQNSRGQLSEMTGIQVVDGGSQSVPSIPVFKIAKEENVTIDDAFMFY